MTDVTKLRAAISKADALLAKYRQCITLMEEMKRTLVLRLLRAENPERQLSIHDQERGLQAHGLKP